MTDAEKLRTALFEAAQSMTSAIRILKNQNTDYQDFTPQERITEAIAYLSNRRDIALGAAGRDLTPTRRPE